MTGRSAMIVAGVAVVAFLIGYGVTALAFTSGSVTTATDITLVPDVRRLTLAEASQRISDAELTVVVADSLPNTEVPAGAILAQTPLPGQEVGSGTEVSVIMSTGQPRPVVPDVAAMPLAMATRSLEAAGFDVFVEEVPGGGPEGRVFEVVPAAGTAIPLPATVVLRVGARPLFLYMPYVVGMQEDSARAALEQMGLEVTEVRYESSSRDDPYHVIDQIPAAGDSIDPGGPVRLFVSMPDVDRGTLRGNRKDRSEQPFYAAGG